MPIKIFFIYTSTFNISYYIANIMIEDNQKEIAETKKEQVKDNDIQSDIQKEEMSIEDKLAESEDKLLRSLAEENQRRRFEKEIKKMLLNLVLLTLQKELAILDNLTQSKISN